MFFQQQLLTQVPTREEIDAEILPTVEKTDCVHPKRESAVQVHVILRSREEAIFDGNPKEQEDRLEEIL